MFNRPAALLDVRFFGRILTKSSLPATRRNEGMCLPYGTRCDDDQIHHHLTSIPALKKDEKEEFDALRVILHRTCTNNSTHNSSDWMHTGTHAHVCSRLLRALQDIHAQNEKYFVRSSDGTFMLMPAPPILRLGS